MRARLHGPAIGGPTLRVTTPFGALIGRFSHGCWHSIVFDDGAVIDVPLGARPPRGAPDTGTALGARDGAFVDASAQLRRQLDEYGAGTLEAFDVPLDWRRLGPFQRAVLEATVTVGYGRTTTYGAIATEIGRPGEARAVGQALRTNPWPIVVPCHRVVAADGALTGYGGGPTTGGRLDRKAALLAHEGQRREPRLF